MLFGNFRIILRSKEFLKFPNYIRKIRSSSKKFASCRSNTLNPKIIIHFKIFCTNGEVLLRFVWLVVQVQVKEGSASIISWFALTSFSSECVLVEQLEMLH